MVEKFTKSRWLNNIDVSCSYYISKSESVNGSILHYPQSSPRQLEQSSALNTGRHCGSEKRRACELGAGSEGFSAW